MIKYIFLLITFILTTYFNAFSQQRKGRYIPTKYDSVKKIIPQQVYGKIDANDADSIANALKIQKENKEQIEKNNADFFNLDKQQKKKINQQKEIEKKELNTNKELNTPKDKIELKETSEKNIQKNVPTKKDDIETKKVKSTYLENKSITPKAIPKQIIGPTKKEKKEYEYRAVWTLAQCIDYAKDNNLQVALADLDTRYAQLLQDESKNSRYPNLNGQIQIGKAFGRNIDPVTNQFVNNNFNYNIAGFTSNTLLFGWFQKKYEIEKTAMDVQAANYANSQLKDDIALNITIGFMRVLLARDQSKLVIEQLAKSKVLQSKDFANDQFYKSKIAMDSAQFIEAKTNETKAILQLKALMNFDYDKKFDIQTSENEASEIAKYYSIPDAETLYNQSLQTKSSIQYLNYQLLSANKSLDIAKAKQYPQLSLFGNFGSVYSSNIKDIKDQTYEGESNAGYVNINGTSYPITNSLYNYSTSTRTWGTQYKNNVRALVGLSLNVPIFNGNLISNNIQKEKIALVNNQIKIDAEKQHLKKEIYTAYEDAKAASQKYIAYQKAADEQEKWLNILMKKSKESASFSDYLQAENLFQNQQSSAIYAKYELLFKLKMLDYLVGNPLKF